MQFYRDIFDGKPFQVGRRTVYPTLDQRLEARGSGKPKQEVRVEDSDSPGFTIIFRRWARGVDPLADQERVIGGWLAAMYHMATLSPCFISTPAKVVSRAIVRRMWLGLALLRKFIELTDPVGQAMREVDALPARAWASMWATLTSGTRNQQRAVMAAEIRISGGRLRRS